MHGDGRKRARSNKAKIVRKTQRALAGCGTAVVALALTGTGRAATANAPPPLFTPATVARAQALLGQMTIDEKIGQMTQLFVFQKSDAVDARIGAGDNAETVTIEAGLREKLGPGVDLKYAPGVDIERHFPSFFDQIFRIPRPGPWTPERAASEFDKAVALAKSSDLVLLTLGEHQQMSGEAASASSIDLPGDQQKLLEAVMAVGKPTVLVLVNGRPLNIEWASGHVPAILELWHPGTGGGAAAADLLFGDAVPGGHLPLAWPRNVGQIPINYAHNLTQDASKQSERYWNEPSTPLYPFGYGLSYARFSFSDLKIEKEMSPVGGKLAVSVEVANTGKMAADEVAQLYIHQRSGRSSRPVRELKGFERVHLAAGERRTVHFTLGPEELRYWSATDRSWGEDPAAFDVWVGADATATLHGSFTRTPAR